MEDNPNRHSRLQAALDHDLNEEELAILQEEISEKPEVSKQWEKLRQTDLLLRSTPMVRPSPDFGARVMAAISALGVPDAVRRYFSVGVALGLAVAAVLTVPLLSALLIFTVRTLVEPAAIAAILGSLTGIVSTVMGLVNSTGQALNDFVTETPVVPALLTTAIPLGMLCAWLIWYLLGWPQMLAARQRA